MIGPASTHRPTSSGPVWPRRCPEPWTPETRPAPGRRFWAFSRRCPTTIARRTA
jgi:hypothetical protein